ncbi:ArsR/SmtB family transcription factor [Leptospira wolffii]|uniref:ArsR/SmtB family transcription factor n=1 Tax=Leptospira wolffii TaxID=409998 RepID=A0A2M9Z7G5_9LEPT|nr:metalloregulator ArsR/SmtB family transcription factor [Leptospira wolffii]EPG67187.1 DNA-binding helix-turn-helix protein [Leptospira wolffii serovar Khorat str. Khorat-H2]PJZ64262.1 transcriptional regulator [Leptospira wolffii]TGK55942.1 transcriptional regulator [Leptospira wolffii]TGK68362.1 transcriptional regulator [Leptospira wolffii]TGK71988.1 transcriptional regulator [Leptospira wolffii]
MPNQGVSLDNLFHALGDPTRRSILERLSLGPATVGELAEPFSMALPSFMQHLGVLEESSLVSSVKSGRVRTYSLTHSTLDLGEEWFVKQRTVWERRLGQLDSYLLDLKEKENDDT